MTPVAGPSTPAPGGDDALRDAFDLGDRIWLNCAHQGPLPRVAAEAAREAAAWKLHPWELTGERFAGVPARLRRALARLLSVPEEQVVLTNGASYGLHLWANGLPLGRGDEVIVMRGDFPSNVLPWLGLAERGVEVRRLRPRRHLLTAGEVEAALGPRTRAVCLSWVHSFSGWTADLEAIGRLCRDRGVLFLVNATQGLGARPLAPGELPIDGLVAAGWKWLLGPYGTGVCWMGPALLDRVRYNQAYWLSGQTADDLAGGRDLPDLASVPPARRYDLFATANFLNFHPFAASLEHLLEVGLERVAARDRQLVDRLVAGLDRDRWQLIGPEAGAERSTLVLIAHRDPERHPEILRRLREAGIEVALRRGRLRIAPHFYNTEGEVDAALEVLDGK